MRELEAEVEVDAEAVEVLFWAPETLHVIINAAKK